MSLRREAAIVAISAVVIELVELGFDRLRSLLNERMGKKKRAGRKKQRKQSRGR